MKTANILICGAGAIGSFLALRLSLGGVNVTLLARGERLAALKGSDIYLSDHSGSHSAKVSVASSFSDLPDQDFTILATKSHDLSKLLSEMANCDFTPGALLTVQNGVTAPTLVAQTLPGRIVLASRVHGFFSADGGTVSHVGVSPSVLLGQVAGPSSRAAAELKKNLTSAGIQTSVTDNVIPALWEKFVLASALGGVGAATDLTVGQILSDPASLQLLHSAIGEVVDLAQAQGLEPSSDWVNDTIAFIRTFPKGAITSMHRDIEAGRISEFPDMIGTVLTLASEKNLPVPAFRYIREKILDRACPSVSDPTIDTHKSFAGAALCTRRERIVE